MDTGQQFRRWVICSRGSLTPVAVPNVSPNEFLSASIPFCLNVDPFPIPCPNPVSNPMP
jgi:hypothetical protein